MKRGKLLLSLAMMCLSIAVLCFGVFAAASVSYSISGTISYTVNDAFVTVSTKVYKGTNQYATDDALSTLATALADGEQTLSNNGFTTDGAYSISDYDSTSGQNFAQKINLTLSSTNKSYLVEMTITNLSSVNVWAKASWSLTGSSVTQGNNTNRPTIKNGTPQKIYFIVSIADLTTSITSTSYTMKLDIGINDMPISFTSEGEELNTTYGTTWAAFVAENSNTYSISDGYVLKSGKLLYDGYDKVESASTIVEGAVYETEVYGIILTDNTKNQFYMNLGTYNGSPIRWNMVSADGTTKYDSTNYATDKTNSSFISNLSGKAIFVQETVVGSDLYFGGAQSGQNYYKSKIREIVKDGSYFGITDQSQLSLVANRKIESINYWKYDSSSSTYVCDDSITAFSNSDGSTDKFWLLSCEEITTFFETSDSRKWLNSNGTSGIEFWLRSPSSENEYLDDVFYVTESGRMRYDQYYDFPFYVRAAFQLA